MGQVLHGSESYQNAVLCVAPCIGIEAVVAMAGSARSARVTPSSV